MAAEATVELLSNFVDREVCLRGWLYNSRSTARVVFLILRDGTGLCQCVVDKTTAPSDLVDLAEGLTQETSLAITGLVRAEPRAPGGYELQVTGIETIGASSDYPITPKPHGIDFLMRHRHLHLRSRRPWAIMRIRHTIIKAIRDFFDSRGFLLVDTPILTPAAGEGTTTLFEVNYFGEPVYLAQTGQLYLEAACMAFRRVYCFGPTFRAEKSKTRRHLTEFWMVEPEVAFIDLDGLMQLAEDFVCHIVEAVLQRCRAELELLERDVRPLEALQRPFVRLSYDDAVNLLRGPATRSLLQSDLQQAQARASELTSQIERLENERLHARKPAQRDRLAQKIQQAREELADLQERLKHIPQHMDLVANFQWGEDLGGADETVISRLHDRPVFVHRYPARAKAFYMKPDPQRPELVLNFDLLAPEGYGEIIGGSMREDDYDALLNRIKQEGLPVEHYGWYLDLRKYGSVPHGGFGLGLERTVAWICGLRHIRETIPFPRLLGKIYP